MTLLSDWPVTLSSLGEASLSYPQQVIRRLLSLASTSESTSISSLSSPLIFIDRLITDPSASAFPLTVLAGLLLLLVGIMSWRDSFNIFRRSPPAYGHSSSSHGHSHGHHSTDNNTPPRVNDSDFSYLTENDIVEPRRTYQSSPPPNGRQLRGRVRDDHGYDDDSGPDILLLKYRGVTYPLHFEPFAIDDGILTVGEIRRRAAEKVGAAEVEQVCILYKGKLLRDDARPCKDDGLKQQSEIMCVVSEARHGESTSDLSGSEVGNRSGSAVSLDSTGNDPYSLSPPGSAGRRKTGNSKRKKKKKQQPQRTSETSIPTHETLAPPSGVRPTSSGRSSAAPSPAPSLQQLPTGNAQVDALLSYLRTELAPQCEQYIAQPPTDPKAREFEHKRLGEMILAQVILKADSIDAEDARMARRGLIKEAQSMLNRLDAAAPAGGS